MSAGRPWLSTRALLVVAALVYTLFVIYGSLVPLEFHAVAWQDAWAKFSAIPFLELGIGSRADWVANLLLFIPLTFLWMGSLTVGAKSAGRWLAALLVIPLAMVTSVAIEFTQLFFPPRTVSQNDILAETLGGMVGVAAWRVWGDRFVTWLDGWRQTHARAALAERFAWVYFAGLLVYNVLPLDLTLSVVELYHKWRDGNVNLLPFARLPRNPVDFMYEVATDILIWVPLAVLWRLDGRRTALRVWSMTFAAAATLEFLQLFVYSRVSDLTDLITASVGAVIGVAVAGRFISHFHPAGAGPSGTPRALFRTLPFVFAMLWALALLLVFWYPFNFRTDGVFLRERLAGSGNVLFEAYYFGTEFRAITEVLHKTLFFAPLGGFLAWGVTNQPWRWRGPLMTGAMLIVVGWPAVIEIGQLMLPTKIFETTDWLLASLGGLGGYFLIRKVLRAPLHQPAARVDSSRPDMSTKDPYRSSGLRWHVLASVGAMALTFWVIAHLPFVPYNVRELFSADNVWLSALLLALACYWLATWPVWLARRHISGAPRFFQLFLGLAAYGAVAFALLDAAVSDEALHDLVGSPVLDWPWKLEAVLRWMALAALPGALLYLATQTVRRIRGLRLGALHFLAVIPILVVAYWGIVVAAATDNLTELLASPAPLAFAGLCMGLYLVFLSAAWMASPETKARLVAGLIALPAAALCLYLALDDDIDKYGQRFSALQFLLSPDREHYASTLAVWMRYVAVHALVVTVLVSLQWPYFRMATRRIQPPPSHAHH